MIILDTSIWIEFLKQNPKYYNKIKELLENQKILAVECIFGELLQGTRNKREKEILLNYWDNLPKCESKNVWIDAGILSAERKFFSKGIGLIDCAILTSAQKNNSKLWTLDKKLKSILTKEEEFTVIE